MNQGISGTTCSPSRPFSSSPSAPCRPTRRQRRGSQRRDSNPGTSFFKTGLNRSSQRTIYHYFEKAAAAFSLNKIKSQPGPIILQHVIFRHLWVALETKTNVSVRHIGGFRIYLKKYCCIIFELKKIITLI